MTKKVIWSLLLFILGACSQVYFNAPQPEKGKPMGSFPRFMEATYSNDILEVELKDDAIFVNGVRLQLTKELPGKGEVQLRFSNNLYFANFSDSIYFSVFMAQFYDDKLVLYMLSPDERSVNVLKRYIALEQIQVHSKKSHLITPVKKEFANLVDLDLFESFAVLTKQMKK
jgi:hypothetical protein